MAITFDIDKKKSISMLVETSGIEDNKKLKFTFNITVDGIKYGFPCKLEENRVDIEIPPLTKIINGLKSGIYEASLDVTGNGKHFLQPFAEDVILTREPKIEVIAGSKNDKEDVKEEIMASISKIIENKEPEPDVKAPVVPEVKPEKKPHKFDKIFK